MLTPVTSWAVGHTNKCWIYSGSHTTNPPTLVFYFFCQALYRQTGRHQINLWSGILQNSFWHNTDVHIYIATECSNILSNLRAPPPTTAILHVPRWNFCPFSSHFILTFSCQSHWLLFPASSLELVRRHPLSMLPVPELPLTATPHLCDLFAEPSSERSSPRATMYHRGYNQWGC